MSFTAAIGDWLMAAPLTLTDTGHRICAQCNASDDGTLIEHRQSGDAVWVHKDCRRFWDRSRGQVYYGESDDEAWASADPRLNTCSARSGGGDAEECNRRGSPSRRGPSSTDPFKI
jgi:hypothetical protein